MSSSTLRTFVAYVEDRPGVLNRVTSLFRRRAYNIQSLTVGRTHVAGISRLTVSLEADDDGARRIEANVYKLIDVLWVRDITRIPSVQRDLALIKVKASAEVRASVLQLCEVFRAHVVDVAEGTLMLEITGTDDKLDGFLDVLRPLGVVEMVRTGMIAMTRGPESPALAFDEPFSRPGEQPAAA
jgi:acetolactate synthase-1/3 small subunit